MKKLLALMLILVMVFSLAACGGDSKDSGNDGSDAKAFDYDAISDDCESADGTFAIAFITDVGQLKDKSFNQGTWEGVKRYASENEKTYKYYRPANGNEATDADRYDAMKAACDAGAEIVVSAGFLQEKAIVKAASNFPDVKFVFVDGYPVKDSNGNILKNVAPVSFNEEQSGYLAGYAVVKEGMTKLGFSGGGGGANPAVNRFGYGFAQGADAAAKEMDKKVEMNYSFEYGANFSPSTELQAMLNGWYKAGTECIFVCGGNMCQSGFAAAAENDRTIIGVDVDQSAQSDTVITSATKGLRESVMVILDKFYSDKWDEVGGVQTVLGAADNAVGLPVDTWTFETFTIDDYNALFDKMKSGEIKVDGKYPKNYKDIKLDNVTIK